MLVMKPPFHDPAHQFSRYLRVFTAAEHEVQHVLVAFAIDPQRYHRRLVTAEATAVEHQPTPSHRRQIFASQFLNKPAAR